MYISKASANRTSRSCLRSRNHEKGYVDSGIGPSGPGPVSARHFADTSAQLSAQMRDDFEVTSLAIWCRARIQRAMRRTRRDVAQQGARGLGVRFQSKSTGLSMVYAEPTIRCPAYAGPQPKYTLPRRQFHDGAGLAIPAGRSRTGTFSRSKLASENGYGSFHISGRNRGSRTSAILSKAHQV